MWMYEDPPCAEEGCVLDLGAAVEARRRMKCEIYREEWMSLREVVDVVCLYGRIVWYVV